MWGRGGEGGHPTHNTKGEWSRRVSQSLGDRERGGASCETVARGKWRPPPKKIQGNEGHPKVPRLPLQPEPHTRRKRPQGRERGGVQTRLPLAPLTMTTPPTPSSCGGDCRCCCSFLETLSGSRFRPSSRARPSQVIPLPRSSAQLSKQVGRLAGWLVKPFPTTQAFLPHPPARLRQEAGLRDPEVKRRERTSVAATLGGLE